ncbi:hypothetical protein HYV11_02210 [Candidatus Dependentiae bacterium]|nr:hypothetical protein [Candidatus Dependentiae bacterium]
MKKISYLFLSIFFILSIYQINLSHLVPIESKAGIEAAKTIFDAGSKYLPSSSKPSASTKLAESILHDNLAHVSPETHASIMKDISKPDERIHLSSTKVQDDSTESNEPHQYTKEELEAAQKTLEFIKGRANDFVSKTKEFGTKTFNWITSWLRPSSTPDATKKTEPDTLTPPSKIDGQKIISEIDSMLSQLNKGIMPKDLPEILKKAKEEGLIVTTEPIITHQQQKSNIFKFTKGISYQPYPLVPKERIDQATRLNLEQNAQSEKATMVESTESELQKIYKEFQKTIAKEKAQKTRSDLASQALEDKETISNKADQALQKLQELAAQERQLIEQDIQRSGVSKGEQASFDKIRQQFQKELQEIQAEGTKAEAIKKAFDELPNEENLGPTDGEQEKYKEAIDLKAQRDDQEKKIATEITTLEKTINSLFNSKLLIEKKASLDQISQGLQEQITNLKNSSLTKEQQSSLLSKLTELEKKINALKKQITEQKTRSDIETQAQEEKENIKQEWSKLITNLQQLEQRSKATALEEQARKKNHDQEQLEFQKLQELATKNKQLIEQYKQRSDVTKDESLQRSEIEQELNQFAQIAEQQKQILAEALNRSGISKEEQTSFDEKMQQFKKDLDKIKEGLKAEETKKANTVMQKAIEELYNKEMQEIQKQEQLIEQAYVAKAAQKTKETKEKAERTAKQKARQKTEENAKSSTWKKTKRLIIPMAAATQVAPNNKEKLKKIDQQKQIYYDQKQKSEQKILDLKKKLLTILSELKQDPGLDANTKKLLEEKSNNLSSTTSSQNIDTLGKIIEQINNKKNQSWNSWFIEKFWEYKEMYAELKQEWDNYQNIKDLINEITKKEMAMRCKDPHEKLPKDYCKKIEQENKDEL